MIPEIIKNAQDSQKETGIPASLTIAQWIHESRWGLDTPAKDSNNPFGIKEPDPNKPRVFAPTWEEDESGKAYQVEQPFAVFPSLKDAFTAHAQIFWNGYYPEAARLADENKNGGNHTVWEFIDMSKGESAIGAYATDSTYEGHMKRNIDTYNLTQYDQTS